MFRKIAFTVLMCCVIASVAVYYHYMYMLFDAILGSALPIVIMLLTAICAIMMLYKYIEHRKM
jgi:hypothetical protein